MNRAMGVLALALGLGIAGTACEEKKTSSDTSRGEDAGLATDKFVTADPKLEAALKAAAAASANTDNGPPPGGVFAPGAADHRHPKGAPTKVDIIAEGASPQLVLASSADGGPLSRATSYGPAVLELAMQIGPRSALPTVDFAMLLGPAKKDEGGDDWLVATVKHASPAKDQYGQLPPGVDKVIGALDGTQFRLQLTPDGKTSDLQTQIAKGAPPEIERIALNGAEALAMDVVPLPAKPVGVGAQWIAESRGAWSGVDVILYRAFRVKSVDGDRLHMTVDVKGYATESDAQLPGLPKGMALDQFDAEGQGELELVRGEVLPRKITVQQRIVMLFKSPDSAGVQDPSAAPGEPPRNGGSFQAQGEAALVRGDDLRAAAR